MPSKYPFKSHQNSLDAYCTNQKSGNYAEERY